MLPLIWLPRWLSAEAVRLELLRPEESMRCVLRNVCSASPARWSHNGAGLGGGFTGTAAVAAPPRTGA
eukprot:2106976-Pyramimonas_sp.AAC.1